MGPFLYKQSTVAKNKSLAFHSGLLVAYSSVCTIDICALAVSATVGSFSDWFFAIFDAKIKTKTNKKCSKNSERIP